MESFNQERMQFIIFYFMFPVFFLFCVTVMSLNLCLPKHSFVNLPVHMSVSVPLGWSCDCVHLFLTKDSALSFLNSAESITCERNVILHRNL